MPTTGLESADGLPAWDVGSAPRPHRQRQQQHQPQRVQNARVGVATIRMRGLESVHGAHAVGVISVMWSKFAVVFVVHPHQIGLQSATGNRARVAMSVINYRLDHALIGALEMRIHGHQSAAGELLAVGVTHVRRQQRRPLLHHSCHMGLMAGQLHGVWLDLAKYGMWVMLKDKESRHVLKLSCKNQGAQRIISPMLFELTRTVYAKDQLTSYRLCRLATAIITWLRLMTKKGWANLDQIQISKRSLQIIFQQGMMQF